MPISSYAVIPDVINKLVIKNPNRVLDLGIGNGLYGSLIRNYLKVNELVGVEGWDGYRNNLWHSYDKIFVGIIPKVLNRIEGKFDAIIMCDVIEHFEKQQGLEIIKMLKSMLNKKGILIISTPDIFCEQGAVGGNELEIHRSLWQISDMEGFDPLRKEHPDRFGHYMQVYFYQN